MIKYVCKKCNLNTELSECPICGDRTEIVETTVHWCDHCKIPLYEDVCPLCGKQARRIGSDIRPVFPEERLLLEILLDAPFLYKESSVWNTSGNHYYADGKPVKFSVSQTKKMDAQQIRKRYDELSHENTYDVFEEYIYKFLIANRKRYDYISSEAMEYIRKASKDADLTEMFVSFSGGKDSTVVSDLVMRALGTQQVLHLYGDTTIEFPETAEYVARFKKNHKKTPVITSKNKDKDFLELCEQLGPPSRVMRWCCTIFKTGAIQRKIQTLFRNQKRILTFYGIRRSESVSRSKYDNVILQMYSGKSEKNDDPEEKKTSPFESLGLISRTGGIYTKKRPPVDLIDPLVILYMVIDELNVNESMQIDYVVDGRNMPGKLLNLNRITVNRYLDDLQNQKMITVERTAGLDIIYPADCIKYDRTKIIREFFERKTRT